MNINLIKLLLQLKNASLVKRETIQIKCNSSGVDLLKLLYKEGFVQSFNIDSTKQLDQKKQFQVTVFLRFFYNKSVLKTLKIISTPSASKYLTLKDISKIKSRKNVLFLSTSKGFLTSLDCKKQKIGGTLLFII